MGQCIWGRVSVYSLTSTGRVKNWGEASRHAPGLRGHPARDLHRRAKSKLGGNIPTPPYEAWCPSTSRVPFQKAAMFSQPQGAWGWGALADKREDLTPNRTCTRRIRTIAKGPAKAELHEGLDSHKRGKTQHSNFSKAHHCLHSMKFLSESTFHVPIMFNKF